MKRARDLTILLTIMAFAMTFLVMTSVSYSLAYNLLLGSLFLLGAYITFVFGKKLVTRIGPWKSLGAILAIFLLLLLCLVTFLFLAPPLPYPFMPVTVAKVTNYSASIKAVDFKMGEFVVQEEFGIRPMKLVAIQSIPDSARQVFQRVGRELIPVRVPFELRPYGGEYIVVVTKTLASTSRGFLTKELSFSPSSLRLKFLESSADAESKGLVPVLDNKAGRTQVALSAFPKGSFLAAKNAEDCNNGALYVHRLL